MSLPAWTHQADAEVPFDWGPNGVEAIRAPYIVIVDVLRFTTAVDAAVARGARNARSVAAWLNEVSREVAVIACGERWPDGSLRPSLEDHLGAGAILAHLHGDLSPEARAAVALWNSTEPGAADAVRTCVSGRELCARGWEDDLEFAVALHASTTVPLLVDGAFVDAGRG